MKLSSNKSLKYIIPAIFYIGLFPVVNHFLKDDYISYFLKTIVTAVFLLYYIKEYKELKKFKLSLLSILTGILIFLMWISLEGIYQRFPGLPYTPLILPNFFTLTIIIKLIGFILIAPLVEELFVRSFLLRFLLNPDFEKVKIGTYSLFSFILTVLFFGFAHNQWLPGLITGILLNLLLYKTKNIWSCIQAHLTANIILAVYIILTQNWIFW